MFACCFNRLLIAALCSLLLITAQGRAEPVDVAQQGDGLEAFLNRSEQGDLFEMIERGYLRVAVTYSKTHYFMDEGHPYGLTYETLRTFEKYLQGRYRSMRKGRAFSVVVLPVPRDQLLTMLEQGKADLAIANLTITPARKQQADFSIPSLSKAHEVIVSSSSVAQPHSFDDLAGKRIVVRKSSSFYEHLQALNAARKKQGLPTFSLELAEEYLETEDLLEMVNAGLIDYTVADLHIAELWAEIFDNIRIDRELTIASDTQVAWAMRKGTPNLAFEVNRFLKKHRTGTTFGNVLRNRYLKNPYWAKRALSQSEQEKFTQVVQLFHKYADQYAFDYLMLMAQAYQESRLDHSKRSPVGAIGIMQVLPSTAKYVDIDNIEEIEQNVHAGTKYLRRLIDHYFADPALTETNRVLFAFAAYNAGPTRIQKLRRKAAAQGFDPNQWFGHVEHVVARSVGQEPVRYVSNISKYYIAYRLIATQLETRAAIKANGI